MVDKRNKRCLCTISFPRCVKRWDASNLLNGAWNISTEDGKIVFFIPQWYAQPAKIDNTIFQAKIDPHHIFVNNRGMCCSKGMHGMAWE
jgi:hypothetical protein